MISALYEKYTFADVTIWCKCIKEKDKYICLTDWQPRTHEVTLNYESVSEYLVALYSYQRWKFYVAPLSINELFELAGCKENTIFLRQLLPKNADAETSASAMVLAKKLIETNSFNTKCLVTKIDDDNFNCEFKRRKMGKKHRDFVTLFTKTLVSTDKGK